MADFAKIVTASDGEQVLYFKDNGDEGPELVAMTNMDGITLRVGLGFADTDDGEAKREAQFNSVGVEHADEFRATAASMVR